MNYTFEATFWRGNALVNPQHGTKRPYAVLRKTRKKIWSMFEEYMSAIPCRVSSDVHEWCNDWETVSRTRSVKMHFR